jgi:seryl-tRNA synthetase
LLSWRRRVLDLKYIRENLEAVKKAVLDKGDKVDVDRIIELDRKRRDIIVEVEQLKEERNKRSKEIAELKKAGEEPEDLLKKMRGLSSSVKDFDQKLQRVEGELQALLLYVPNIPHESVPVGEDEDANEFVRSWGEVRQFEFEPRPHWDIGKRLGILDIERGGKVTGSGFIHYQGLGARLERALIIFMIDFHVDKHGYTEALPPFIVNRESMTTTGQLPKLVDDMYLVTLDDLFLIPTAEVPLTNLHRDEIMRSEELPRRYVAYTPCFRREAGAHGKDTRGLIRVHQFNKVELVKFVEPANSYDELDKLLCDAEDILQVLALPYRVMLLSTGDLSFSATKCYDIEVWAPGLGKHLEVSSCSNFEDFQARRGNIRYRPGTGKKLQYVHTLNGSGVALPRTVIAIIENYQNEDGSVTIPEVLREYMGGLESIQ